MKFEVPFIGGNHDNITEIRSWLCEKLNPNAADRWQGPGWIVRMSPYKFWIVYIEDEHVATEFALRFL